MTSLDSVASLVEELMHSLMASTQHGSDLHLQSLEITYPVPGKVSVHMELGITAPVDTLASTWTEQNTHLTQR